MKIVSLTPTDTADAMSNYQREAALILLECRYEAIKERADRSPETLTPSLLREFLELSKEINRIKTESARRLLDKPISPAHRWTIYRNPQK